MSDRIRENPLEHKNAAFTLVELIIVTAILGILAAIVLPEFQGHVQQAKEATAKDNLRILRESIERYAAEHNGVPPGYPSNNVSIPPSSLISFAQLQTCVNQVPENPFNGLNTIYVLQSVQDFSVGPTGTTGWIYQPSTRKIKLNTSGTDSANTQYYDY